MMPRALAGVVVAICIWLAGFSSHAMTEGHMSLSNLIARSGMIVVGTAFDLTSAQRFFGDYERVVTDVMLADIEIVKGASADTGLIVTQLGGQIGDVMEWYPGMPTFDLGRRYLVFLLRTELGDAVPLGMQGLFLVETDPARGLEVVTSANGQPVIGIQEDFVQLDAAGQEDADPKEGLSAAMTLQDFLGEIKARLN